MPSIIYGTNYEDGGAVLLARVHGWANVPITQATVSAIVYRVTDLRSNVVTDADSLTVASVIYDTLQTDVIWTQDTTGYNFKHTLAAAAFPLGSHTYQVDVRFTPVTGPVFFAIFHITTLEVRLS